MTNEDLLYRYFSNSLTENELIDFNKRIETDAEFKADFEFENNLKQAIKQNNTTELKEKLKVFEAEISVKEPRTTKPQFNWRIAASIVLFIGAGWFGYNALFGVDYNNIYNANFNNYPNTEFTITRSDTVDSYERKAFVAYEAQDYDNAILNFNTIPVAEQKGYQDFYVALSYLNNNDSEKAKDLFKKTVAYNKMFVAESHWYLALVAIKQKDKIAAIKQLRILLENFDYNKSKAEVLLKELH
ncbi:tetratricopeptide repeat protein [Lacinutrix sp. Bg11-31]|uniref:tetratricopeptide repeat protein n=1 Tax=Lacinutrix sp. Bg11-31 TaxID=2057808 RepID=UPI000C3112FD|nr:tetratricopeptide repeat protein [Lacinutrix sp. Bg11-31]AUC83607.1 hypothetical protein CW733_16320 [Lacinutrix sp. Bg11-31]